MMHKVNQVVASLVAIGALSVSSSSNRAFGQSKHSSDVLTNPLLIAPLQTNSVDQDYPRQTSTEIAGTRVARLDPDVFETLVIDGHRHFRISLHENQTTIGLMQGVEHLSFGMTVLTASIEHESDSTIRLTRTQDGFVGFLRSPTLGMLSLRADSKGHLTVKALDARMLATCGMNDRPVVVPLLGGFRSARSSGVPIPTGCDDGSTIDLLVAYTTDARIAAGGQAAIESLINLAIADANDAFENSNIATSLNLVHAEEINYAESGVWTIDGPRLIDPEDGFLDEVHHLRDMYGADCVSLWVNTLDTGGIGYFPDPSLKGIGSSGLSMMRLDNAALLTLAHEIGHNFFCAHDRPNAPDPPFTDYSYGFVEPSSQWRTIMATTATPHVIPYFSNPNVNWPGPLPPNPGPTGVPEGQPNSSDNARTINELRSAVANFRTSGVPGLSSTLFVDNTAAPGGDGQSWLGAVSDLQDALCLAKGSDGTVQEIWLRAGTYKPDGGGGDRDATFTLVDGVSILGGFDGTELSAGQRNPDSNVTILSGDIGTPEDQSDNSYHVVDGSLNDATAILDGVTISGGRADGLGPRHGGGGVIISGGGTPQFVDCIFRDNVAASFGGGMFNTNGSAPTLIGCTFENNSVTSTAWPAGGGGIYNYSLCSPTLTDCAFRSNTARLGSGMANFFSSSPELSGCTFVQNAGSTSSEGGAIYGYSSCSPTINDCVFDSNSATLGGAIVGFFNCSPMIDRCIFRRNTAFTNGGGLYNYSNSNVELVNCLLVGNSAASGGAINNLFGSAAKVTNCTIVGNTGTFGAGGISNLQSDPTIANSVIWKNAIGATTDESAQIGNDASTPVISQSTIQGWTGSLGGIGNNGSDPDLRDADGADDLFGTEDDNARPRPGSVAIDTGDNAALPGGITLDLDHRPRIVNALVDRGAYEFDPIPGDFDGDINIDLVDHAAFVDCMSGPGAVPNPTPPATPQECQDAFDFDADLDIDLNDFAQFAIAY